MPSTVIIVPGFLGSTLEDPSSALLLGNLWLNPPSIAAGLFPRLKLPIPSEGGGGADGPAIRPGYPLPAYYGPLSAFLASQGWRVVAAAQDWRGPVAADAARLADVIRAEAPLYGSVRVVAHSRGGLVARAAVALLAATGQSTMVRRVVTLGTPHTGSLNAAAALAGWLPLITSLSTLGRYTGAAVAAHLGAPEVVNVMRSWPAIYELLPAPGATWLPAATVAALYDPATWSGSTFRPVSAYLAAAAAFWAALPPRTAGVDWIDVVGYGQFTHVGIPDLADITVPYNFSGDNTGDGAVPVASAHTAGVRALYTPTAHDLLPLDYRLAYVLASAVMDGLGADVTMNGVLASLAPTQPGENPP